MTKLNMRSTASTLHDQTFITAFKKVAQSEPERVFASSAGAKLTLRGLDVASNRFRTALQNHGLKRGDRVAVMMRNSIELVSILFAIAKAGLVWIPVNVQLRHDGLRYILDHSDPQLVICDEDLLVRIKGSASKLRAGLVLNLANLIQASQSDAKPALLDSEPGFDDLFAIMYTSGTTGPPKGVLVTYGMMSFAAQGASIVSDVRAGDLMLVWEPFYHIGGAQVLLLPIFFDVSLSLVPKFSASRFWDDVRASNATHIHYLGGILQLLMKQLPSPLDRVHSVRIAWGGGCPKHVWCAFEQRFGVEIRECYGLTEASSISTFNDGQIIGSVGRSLPWFDVCLKDESNRPVALGPAQIVLRSSEPGALFPGYFRDPEATKKVMDAGEFFTGDIGSFDSAGNLYLHGRITENVRCHGENVSAWEVESVVSQHPEVEDCVIIGVSSDVGEQEIKLFVKPKAHAIINPARLWLWLSERLAPFQNPRYIAVVDDFERTPSQRIMRHRLSSDLQNCWDRTQG